MESEKRLCAICGTREATTLDHLPPRSIFPKPRPGNLITVPACFACNHGASNDDEKFRVFLSIQVGPDQPDTKKLWKEHALKTLRKNRKLHRIILKGMRHMEFRTEAGLYVGHRTVFLWPANVHNKVIERVARGLYYHHYGEILGDRVVCEVAWLNSLDKDFLDQSKRWPQTDIGNGAVIYRYVRATESMLSSVWVFQFYRRHWAMVETNPIERPNVSTSS